MYRPGCGVTEDRWLSHHGESKEERRVVRMRIENDSPDTARLVAANAGTELETFVYEHRIDECHARCAQLTGCASVHV